MRSFSWILIILSIFWFSSCSYELSYKGELGKGTLPQGDEYAQYLSLAAMETEELLFIQLPPEGNSQEKTLAGKILTYSLTTREYLKIFTNKEGEDIRGSEIFITTDGLLGVVNQDPFVNEFKISFYRSNGKLIYDRFITVPPPDKTETFEKFYSFSLSSKGDLLALYGWDRGRPGGIIRISDFAQGKDSVEFVNKEKFSDYTPLSEDGPFRFCSLRFVRDNYYLTIDMAVDPYDGIMVLDNDLNPIRYITGFWHFNCPWDVAVDDQGIIYTSNFYHDSLKAHDGEGILARSAPDDYEGYKGKLMNNPADMVLANNHIYIYDSDNGRINIFTTLDKTTGWTASNSSTQFIIPIRLGLGSLSLNLLLIFLGIMIMISLNALIFSLVLKEKIFLYFGLFYLSAILFFINSSFDRFFFTLAHRNLLGPWLMLLFLIPFIDRFIDLKEPIPIVDKIKKIFISFNIFFYILSIIQGITEIKLLKFVVNKSGDIYASVFVLSLLYYLIYLTRKGNRNSRILLYFTLILCLTGLAAPGTYTILLVKYGLVYPPLIYGGFPTQIGFLISGFLLTYLLGRRIVDHRIFTVLAEEKHRNIKELDKKKTRYIMNISHELRTPLTLIQGLTRQIMKGKWGDSIQKNRPNFETIDRNTLKLLKQVNNFLELSRIEQNHREPKLRTIDISSLLNLIVKEFQPRADYLNIKLLLEVNEGCTLQADPYLFEIALMNLLSNAFKFTQSPGEIKLEGSSNKEEVKISVSDTGTGIREEDQKVVFSPFEQVGDDPYSNKGTGLGLSLVKEIMTLHKGQIILESIFGSGSTFSMIFPFNNKKDLPVWSVDTRLVETLTEEYQSDLYGVDKLPENQLLQRGRRLVLLVEDDPDMMKYLISEMTPHFSLTWAFNGKEALKILTKFKPDLIISDIMMPEMDGWTLFEQLQKKISTQHIPFLFLTARNSFEEKLEALNKGIVDYLEKPFSPEEFIIRVKSNIEKGRIFKTQYKQQLKKSLIDFVDNFEGMSQKNDKLLFFDKEVNENGLSPREKEILQCITKGLSDKQIASELRISVKTVGNHNSSIFKKMKVSSRMELLLLKNP